METEGFKGKREVTRERDKRMHWLIFGIRAHYPNKGFLSPALTFTLKFLVLFHITKLRPFAYNATAMDTTYKS